MKYLIYFSLILILVSCSSKTATINQIKSLSEENGRIKQKLVLYELYPEINWHKVDSLYNIKYE